MTDITTAARSYRAPKECSQRLQCSDPKKCDRPKDIWGNHLRVHYRNGSHKRSK